MNNVICVLNDGKTYSTAAGVKFYRVRPTDLPDDIDTALEEGCLPEVPYRLGGTSPQEEVDDTRVYLEMRYLGRKVSLEFPFDGTIEDLWEDGMRPLLLAMGFAERTVDELGGE